MGMRVLISCHLCMCFFHTSQIKAAVLDDGGYHLIDNPLYERERVHVDLDAPTAGTQVEIVNGGLVGDLLLYNQSQATLSGGDITDDLSAFHEATINVIDGTINQQTTLNDNTEMVISGGIIGTVHGYDQSTITLRDNSITAEIKIGDDSSLEMHGGTVTDDIQTRQSGMVTIWDGAILNNLNGTDNGQIFVYGGTIGYLINTIASATITFYGTFNFPYGPLPVGNINWPMRIPSGHLIGTLANGDPIDNDFYIFDNSSIILAPIPEPTTLTLLALGGLALRRMRKP